MNAHFWKTFLQWEYINVWQILKSVDLQLIVQLASWLAI